jgi:hypothetical protein
MTNQPENWRRQVKTIKVVVTQEHIDKGERGDCYSCAVSLALRDSDIPEARMGLWSIFLHGKFDDDKNTIDAPPQVKQFVRDFDQKRPVQPFEFEIEVPE